MLNRMTSSLPQQTLLIVISTLSILTVAALIVSLSAETILPLLGKWWLLALPIPLLLVGMHYREKLSTRWQVAFTGLMVSMVICFGVLCVQIMVSNIITKPEWDLKWFWIHARAAALGLNFYQPESVHLLAAQYGPNSPLFLSQLYFWYPPPTMLLMLPLGWFDMETGFVLWQAAHMVLLVADIILLWRLFLRDSGGMGLLFVAALIAGLHPVIDTVYAGQTNFMLLFLILLYWRDRDRPRAALWLTVAIFVKPVAGILVLIVLLRRQWKVLGVMLGCALIAALVSILAFGLPTFMSYFTNSPMGNLDPYMLTMPFNQSLLATILRATQYDVSLGSGFTHPLFVVAAGVLILFTSWIVYRLSEYMPDWTLALVIVLALLIYPHSLRYYAVLLVPLFLLLWSARERLPGGVWGMTTLLTLLYWLSAYRPGDMIFMVMLVVWFMIAAGVVYLHQRSLHSSLTIVQR
jgi:hypothetical protein